MKRKILFFLVFILKLECFSQASATATVTATIISIDDLFSVHKVHGLKSRTDSVRVIDSLLTVDNKLAIRARILKNKETSVNVSEIPFKEMIFPTEKQSYKQKWLGEVHLSVFDDILGLVWKN
ncbi:MAG: hypothetical protein WAV23_02390 [Minisyncoccia bacterium]